MYTVYFTEVADADVLRWKKSGQKIMMNRISKLLADIQEHPYIGIGKPEPLRFDLAGKYSRRINDEHRIIYAVDDIHQSVTVYSLYGHYEKQ